MRIATLVVTACLAGCSLTPTGSVSECNTNAQCGDDVCASSGECLARSSVREMIVRWTVNGVAPDPASCASHPSLYLQFEGADYGDTLRIASVPCIAGAYQVKQLPKRYLQVEVGFEGHTGDVSAIDSASPQVQFDLGQ
jgi:hypothetical protein